MLNDIRSCWASTEASAAAAAAASFEHKHTDTEGAIESKLLFLQTASSFSHNGCVFIETDDASVAIQMKLKPLWCQLVASCSMDDEDLQAKLEMRGGKTMRRETKIGENPGVFVSCISTVQMRECAPTKTARFSEGEDEHTDICTCSNKVSLWAQAPPPR